MRAVVLRKIPDPNTSTTIATDNLALVGVNDYIVDRATVGIASLNGSASSLPDLHGAILRAGDHPLSLAVKRDSSDVASMSFESEKRIRVC